MHHVSPLLVALGNCIRARRKTLSLSQMALGQKAGLHRTYIADVERGSRNVSILNVERLVLALGVTLGEFFAEVQKEMKTATVQK